MTRYYWCLRHDRVETDADKCDVTRLLGPYTTRTEADSALLKIRERNEDWEAEDARWSGDD